MSYSSTIDAAGVNIRHQRFGASTLYREQIYPFDIANQIVRGQERKKDSDFSRTSKEMHELVALAGGKDRFFSPARVQARPPRGVLFDPGSVLNQRKVAFVRRKKREQLNQQRVTEIHMINYRWGRKYGFREEEVSELERKFHEYDKDDSGTIDLKECEHIIDDLNILSDAISKGHKSKKRDALKFIIDELDKTKSGTLNFIQFMDLIKRVREGRLQELMGDFLYEPRTYKIDQQRNQKRAHVRPKSASSTSSFHSTPTICNPKIAQARAKRADRLKDAEKAKLESFIVRSARRMRLSKEETKKALGLGNDLIQRRIDHMASQIQSTSQTSPRMKAPKKARFVKLAANQSPRARRGVVTGGYVVSAEETNEKEKTNLHATKPSVNH